MTRKIRVFLSMATDEFGSFRDEIGNWLRGALDVEMQSNFAQATTDSLSALQQRICHPNFGKCDFIIHIVGNQVGSLPSNAERSHFLARYQQTPFLSSHPWLQFELGELDGISYTQLESYLAIELGVSQLFYSPAQSKLQPSQLRHLERVERAIGRPSCKFVDESQLWKLISKDVLYFLSTKFRDNLDVVPQLQESPKFEAIRVEQQNCLQQLLDFSEPLLDWPTTIPGGGWLERPELETLKNRINEEHSSVSFIVGKPGSGKSALLSELAKWSVDSKHTLLAIKSDFLDAKIENLNDLSHAILTGQPDLINELRNLSTTGKLIVIVDQLDALANLADLRSGRLNAVLDLIRALVQLETVHVVASVRTFELEADERLRNLVCGGSRIDLGGLSREQVLISLSANQLQAEKWPTEYLEFLQVPYHLSLFLKHCQLIEFQGDSPPEAHLFSSIHAVHDQRWSSLLDSRSDRNEIEQVLFQLVDKISETESLWQPIESVKPLKETQLSLLIDSGWLCIDRDRDLVGFAHQTQYEFLLAKKFSGAPDAFFQYVWKRRNGLFVRPAVWQVLSYLRSENRTGYIRLLGSCIAQIERRHLQRLFQDFLTQVPDPEPAEVRWIKSYLEDETTYATTAWLVRGKAAWFKVLDEPFLAGLMNCKLHDGWPITRVLEKAWQIDRDKVARLLRTNWAYQENFLNLMLSVLHECDKFDSEHIAWCLFAMQKPSANTWLIERVLDRVSKSTPAAASRLLAVVLNRQLQNKLVTPSDTPLKREDFESDEDFQVDSLVSSTNPSKSFEDLLDCKGFFNVQELAARAPSEFCRSIWPWFVGVVKECDAGDYHRMNSYRREWANRNWFRNQHHSGSEIVVAMQASLKSWAMDAPFEFLQFFLEHEHVDSLVCHRLFAAALASIAHQIPEFVWNYFEADDRRILLGESDYSLTDTLMLLRATIPYWEENRIEWFQRRILGWQVCTETSEADPEGLKNAEARESRLRVRILSLIPKAMRIAEAQHLISAMDLQRQDELVERQCENNRDWIRITAPIEAEDMATLPDAEIMSHIQELPDSTGRDHPTDWRLGGSQMLAEEFCKFAETNPTRAIAIMRELQAGQHENVAGGGFRGLKSSPQCHAETLTLIQHLIDRGFSTNAFRDDVGRCLHQIALDCNGLSKDICETLEGWLLEFQPATDDSIEASDNVKRKNEEFTQSVLWNTTAHFSMPNEWFWIGEALKLGHCLSDPPRDEQWYQFLNRLVELDFPNDVWEAWLFHFCRYVPSRAKAAPAIAKILLRRVDLLKCDAGYITLASFFGVLDNVDRTHLLESLTQSERTKDQQAVAEIAAYCGQIYQDQWSRQFVDKGLADKSNPDVLCGIAFATAALWRTDAYRAASLSLLTRLLRSESESVNSALLSIFYYDDCLNTSEQTRELLKIIAAHLRFDRVREVWPLIRKLKDYLNTSPELVFAVCRAVIDRALELQRQDAWSRLGLSEEELVLIALTLHRNTDPKIRSDALTLFEDLMELQAHGAFEKLNQLDQRMIT